MCLLWKQIPCGQEAKPKSESMRSSLVQADAFCDAVGDEHGHNQAVDGDDPRHDHGDDGLHDELRTHHRHGRDARAALCRAVCRAQGWRDKRRDMRHRGQRRRGTGRRDRRHRGQTRRGRQGETRDRHTEEETGDRPMTEAEERHRHGGDMRHHSLFSTKGGWTSTETIAIV